VLHLPPLSARTRTIAALLAILGLLLIAATVPFWIWSLDLAIQQLFFDPLPSGEGSPWLGKRNALCRWLYEYGTLPAYVVGFGSLGVCVASFAVPGWRRWRRLTAYLALCLAVGPGLIVNAVLKEHWGRPRPRNVEVFGGKQTHEKVWMHDAASGGSSFPSGHAAAGFYFLAAVPLCWRRPRRAALAAGLGLGFGTLIGVSRMAQGGHFASDVLWSAGVCALTSVALYFALGLDRHPPWGPASRPAPAPTGSALGARSPT